MIIDKEDFEVQKTPQFWAGRLLDLPKEQAWEIAEEITEAIKYAESVKSNSVLGGVINCDCGTDNYTKHESTNGIIIYKCKDCGGCL